MVIILHRQKRVRQVYAKQAGSFSGPSRVEARGSTMLDTTAHVPNQIFNTIYSDSPPPDTVKGVVLPESDESRIRGPQVRGLAKANPKLYSTLGSDGPGQTYLYESSPQLSETLHLNVFRGVDSKCTVLNIRSSVLAVKQGGRRLKWSQIPTSTGPRMLCALATHHQTAFCRCNCVDHIHYVN